MRERVKALQIKLQPRALSLWERVSVRAHSGEGRGGAISKLPPPEAVALNG